MSEKIVLACRQCGVCYDLTDEAARKAVYGHAGTCGSDQGFDVVEDGWFWWTDVEERPEEGVPAEANALLEMMERDGLPNGSARWTGKVIFTDCEDWRMVLTEEDDLSRDWAMAWYGFKDAAGIVVWATFNLSSHKGYTAVEDSEMGWGSL